MNRRSQPSIIMGDSRVIKFKNRTNSNTCDKRIAEAYKKGGKFDVDLITADDKKVSAHRFVLSMFSKYLAKLLCDLEFDGKILGKWLSIIHGAHATSNLWL